LGSFLLSTFLCRSLSPYGCLIPASIVPSPRECKLLLILFP
jgi:hypothetical protein